MLRYESIKELGLIDFFKGRIRQVKAVKTYYLVVGRNAWYSTWTQRFHQDRLFIDLQSAKEAAEEQRRSGSKFYIYQLPAIYLAGKNGSVLVSEINTEAPLAGWDRSSSKFRVGCSLARAADAFSYNSKNWIRRPYNEESLFVLGDVAPLRAYEPLKAEPVLMWESWSSGSRYYLSWSEKVGSSSIEAICRIASTAQRKRSARVAIREPLTSTKSPAEGAGEGF